MQGEFHVTEEPDVVLTTILGSCVAACLCDTLARVGGMNHFLLPGEEDRDGDAAALRHGVHAMELLVNGLLQRGARRERLQAKLFGGACMMQGLTDVGRLNADFAERFIRRERIAMTGGSLGGTSGRRIQYWPATGRARQMTLGSADATIFAAEKELPRPSAGYRRGRVVLMPARTSLAATLCAIRHELASLGDQAQQLQDHLSPIARTSHGEALQGLDLMTQRLLGLTYFLDTLIPALPDHTVDLAQALDAVTLSDQGAAPRRPAGAAGPVARRDGILRRCVSLRPTPDRGSISAASW